MDAAVLAPLALTLLAFAPLEAQTDVTIEIGASQVGPQLGDDAESARFGVGGIRASHYGIDGSGISAALLMGRSLGGRTGGDFFSASLGASWIERWGAGWEGGMDARLMGFGIRAPFPYRALAGEGGPVIRYRSGWFSVAAAGVLGLGRSRFEIWRVAGGRTRVFLDDLFRVGGTTELMFGSGVVRAGVVGGVHETRGGTFSSGGGRIVFAGGRPAVELRADLWRTPTGTEATGGLEFIVPLAGWSVRGFLGRSEPDPLTLAGPGSGSAGVLVGRSLYARQPTATPGDYELVGATPSGARIRLRVEAPAGVERVELLGDFTLWEPVPMSPHDGAWEVEIDVEAGMHHYGFLADGAWFVPDEARAVPDEWGRMSAILVIEGVS